jgi:hypothetical protein
MDRFVDTTARQMSKADRSDRTNGGTVTSIGEVGRRVASPPTSTRSAWNVTADDADRHRPQIRSPTSIVDRSSNSLSSCFQLCPAAGDTRTWGYAMLGGMSGVRAAAVVTCVVTAGLGGWFAVARWDQANKLATVASALGAVAAVGVAIWTALRGSPGRAGRARWIRVSGTGKAMATAPGSSAVSGVRGKPAGDVSLRVRDSGDAEAGGGGNAVSGVQLD